jgi:hypothetical protein
VLAITLASCAARHSTEVNDKIAVRHARFFVCREIPNMVAIHVPPHIIEDTVRDASALDTLSQADLECLDGQPIPDRVMNALGRRVRAD